MNNPVAGGNNFFGVAYLYFGVLSQDAVYRFANNFNIALYSFFGFYVFLKLKEISLLGQKLIDFNYSLLNIRQPYFGSIFHKPILW